MYFLIMLRNGDVLRLNTESDQVEEDFQLLLDRLYYLIPLALYDRKGWEELLQRETSFRLDNSISLRELFGLLSPDLIDQFVYGDTADLNFLKEALK